VAEQRTDNQLLVEIQAGCTLAFAELYVRYLPPADRVARRICPDAARAEEAVQEAFSSIWRSRAGYRPDAPTARPWLLAVVRHRAIDINRRDAAYDANRASDVALERCAGPCDVPGEAIADDDRRRVRAGLRRLPEVQRQALELAYYASLSQTEIAVLLGIPLGTIKARMRRGLRRLETEISPSKPY
jgi:RNA polymerase sigma-70 factor (ECF subfamily)